VSRTVQATFCLYFTPRLTRAITDGSDPVYIFAVDGRKAAKVRTPPGEDGRTFPYPHLLSPGLDGLTTSTTATTEPTPDPCVRNEHSCPEDTKQTIALTDTRSRRPTSALMRQEDGPTRGRLGLERVLRDADLSWRGDLAYGQGDVAPADHGMVEQEGTVRDVIRGTARAPADARYSNASGSCARWKIIGIAMRCRPTAGKTSSEVFFFSRRD